MRGPSSWRALREAGLDPSRCVLLRHRSAAGVDAHLTSRLRARGNADLWQVRQSRQPRSWFDSKPSTAPDRGLRGRARPRRRARDALDLFAATTSRHSPRLPRGDEVCVRSPAWDEASLAARKDEAKRRNCSTCQRVLSVLRRRCALRDNAGLVHAALACRAGTADWGCAAVDPASARAALFAVLTRSILQMPPWRCIEEDSSRRGGRSGARRRSWRRRPRRAERVNGDIIDIDDFARVDRASARAGVRFRRSSDKRWLQRRRRRTRERQTSRHPRRLPAPAAMVVRKVVHRHLAPRKALGVSEGIIFRRAVTTAVMLDVDAGAAAGLSVK